nr:integrase, catalytic region, zinc finger, CCHC-type, peptidase aspartic, catalytic [Tanacetum cinerariifolium]
MKDVFKELKAEVAQNVVDRKHDEIERKNLLTANYNLIDECLSKEVFYVAMNSELNVARFTEMHVANNIVEACCLELEAKLSTLHDKSHNDNHNELVNRFSNLEVHHLNMQLKYQNLKVSFGNNPPTPARDTPDFDSVFVIRKMQASLQGKDNVIKQLKKQIYHLQETRNEADRTLNVRALDSQITQLTKKVTVLQAQNDLFRAKNEKIKQHYKELYDSIKNTRKYAIDVEPLSLRLRNNREAHLDYLRNLKESIETICKIVEEAKVTDTFRARTKSGSCSSLCTLHYKDLEFLFQPMFDEYLEPHRVKRPVSPTPVVQVPVNSTGTPSSTTIDQDAPSLSISSSSSALQYPSLHQGITAKSTLTEDNPVAPVDNNPFINVFALEPSSDASSSGDVSSKESTYVSQHFIILVNGTRITRSIMSLATHLDRYPPENNLQLMTCGAYITLYLKVKPKNFKSIITKDFWFQSMQDEIHELDRLQVWELVPQRDCVIIITLKWIYKVKLDEYDDVLKNKARLVAKGYRQEEGIDFEESFAQVARI